MQQIFKIATILLFLGVFIIPKNMYSASVLKDFCCFSTSVHEKDAASDNTEPCHSDDNEDRKKDCNECFSCTPTVYFEKFQKSSFFDEVYVNETSRKNSVYLTPEFSKYSSKIWQPPKIA